MYAAPPSYHMLSESAPRGIAAFIRPQTRGASACAACERAESLSPMVHMTTWTKVDCTKGRRNRRQASPARKLVVLVCSSVQGKAALQDPLINELLLICTPVALPQKAQGFTSCLFSLGRSVGMLRRGTPTEANNRPGVNSWRYPSAQAANVDQGYCRFSLSHGSIPLCRGPG